MKLTNLDSLWWIILVRRLLARLKSSVFNQSVQMLGPIFVGHGVRGRSFYFGANPWNSRLIDSFAGLKLGDGDRGDQRDPYFLSLVEHSSSFSMWVSFLPPFLNSSASAIWKRESDEELGEQTPHHQSRPGRQHCYTVLGECAYQGSALSCWVTTHHRPTCCCFRLLNQDAGTPYFLIEAGWWLD